MTIVERPRFSVVIPAFNEVDYLGRTLQSLLQQDFEGSYEVIVVDNNSTDGTARLARGYGVRVVDEPEVGVCAARQRGADAAVGEIIVSTDADTVHPANWLRSIDANFSDLSVAAVAGTLPLRECRRLERGLPQVAVQPCRPDLCHDRFRLLRQRHQSRDAADGVSGVRPEANARRGRTRRAAPNSETRRGGLGPDQCRDHIPSTPRAGLRCTTSSSVS